MNDPENKPMANPDEEVRRSESAPSTGEEAKIKNKARATKLGKKDDAAPKTKAGDIYSLVENAFITDAGVIDRIFAAIDAMDDSAPLLASLLLESMDGVKPGVWTKLREFDVPAKLFDKLCQVVGVPSLAASWKSVASEIPGILREYVPPSREAAELFLRERSMLPLTILIYRAFRNDEVALGKVMRDWVASISAGCENHKPNIQKEAQRTAKWLTELSSKKSNPGQFLSAVAPVLISLRLGQRAFNDVASLTERQTCVENDLVAEKATNEGLLNRVVNLEATIGNRDNEIATASQRITQLEERIAFGTAHAGVSEDQAVGALKERLKMAILSRTEDARLFLDRSEPNIQEALALLTEIEDQFR